MKLTIVIATRNNHKVREIKKIAAGCGVLIKALSDFPPLPDVKETGKTLEENALLKAETIAGKLNCPVVADDSGLFVPVLEGAPGVRSARYAGPACDDKKNIKKILRAMNGKSGRERRAYFATCMALAVPGKKSKTRIGKIWGKITEAETGENGFGYDPVFVPRGYDETFAQMSAVKKNQLSHRAKALEKIMIEVKKIA